MYKTQFHDLSFCCVYVGQFVSTENEIAIKAKRNLTTIVVFTQGSHSTIHRSFRDLYFGIMNMKL